MAFTPITDNMDCLTAAIVGELVAGLNQRRLAAGGAAFGIPTPAVGDDAHAAAWWSYLQQCVEEMATTFVDHTITGPGPGDGFSGLDDFSFFTLATWRAAAGLNAAGFTRYTTHPSDAGTPLYGNAEVGDVFGPWLLREIQLGLSAMKKTLGSPDWDTGGEYTGSEGHDASWISLADAQEKAKIRFDLEANYWTGAGGPAAASGYEYIPGTPDQWTAYLERNSNFGRWTWPELGTLVKTIEFYNVGSDAGFVEFNASGDFPGGYVPGKLYLYDTQVDVTGTTGLSARFGKRPPGNYPAWGAGGVYAGYGSSSTPVAIIEWTFDL